MYLHLFVWRVDGTPNALCRLDVEYGTVKHTTVLKVAPTHRPQTVVSFLEDPKKERELRLQLFDERDASLGQVTFIPHGRSSRHSGAQFQQGWRLELQLVHGEHPSEFCVTSCGDLFSPMSDEATQPRTRSPQRAVSFPAVPQNVEFQQQQHQQQKLRPSSVAEKAQRIDYEARKRTSLAWPTDDTGLMVYASCLREELSQREMELAELHIKNAKAAARSMATSKPSDELPAWVNFVSRCASLEDREFIEANYQLL